MNNSISQSAASTPEASAREPSGVRPLRTTLAGLLLIAIITPLSQLLTILTVNTAVETMTPAGWVLGTVFSLALAGLLMRRLVRSCLWSRAELALIYCMLGIAIPLMNLGLVRPFFNATHAVMREYVYEGTSTYRTAYDVLSDKWFPKAPTREGLAYTRAERLLRLLEDTDALRVQREARRKVVLSLTDEWTLRQLRNETEEAAAIANELHVAIALLSLDATQDVLKQQDETLLAELGLVEPLQQRLLDAQRESSTAVAFLQQHLPQFTEWEASILDGNLEAMDFSARQRLYETMERMSADAKAGLYRRFGELQELEVQLRAALARLGSADYAQLSSDLVEVELRSIMEMDAAQFDTVRNQFVYRLSREERRNMIQLDGTTGPNQNLWAFEYSLWSDAQQREARERNSWSQNLADLMAGIPWGLYALPLLNWGLLFVAIFLFLMCVAEYFRRKWVSRENLTFPLVEIADAVIRHDYALELGGDARNPQARASTFASMAMLGFAVGFLVLFFEALGHYGFIGLQKAFYFNFNEAVFNPAGGILRDIPAVVFVISPIVIGIAFLLSLEMSFSIWMSFLLYTVAAWILKVSFPNALMDSNWTGFGDGRFHPFPMEQLLGACLVMAVFLLWKARGQPAKEPKDGEPDERYLPAGFTKWGMVILPLVIVAMFWSLGVTSLWIILPFGIVTMAIAIAGARVRAETGLPQFNVFYESTKLPIVLGVTGLAGAKAYAAFVNLVFLPLSLLFRTLPQQLENMELARRHRISGPLLAGSSMAAFITALSVGCFSFLLFVYYIGKDFYGLSSLPPQAGSPAAAQLATYPLWVSHFLGEPGLDKFDSVNWLRVVAMGVGAAVVALMLFLRGRFLRFPLHPIGYLVVLLSIHYAWVSPYMRTGEAHVMQASTVWGGVLVAWMIKKLIVKYGGMNAYKQAKPFFIGMVVGAVVCIFLWNTIHLGANLVGGQMAEPNAFIRKFLELNPYIPSVY